MARGKAQNSPKTVKKTSVSKGIPHNETAVNGGGGVAGKKRKKKKDSLCGKEMTKTASSVSKNDTASPLSAVCEPVSSIAHAHNTTSHSDRCSSSSSMEHNKPRRKLGRYDYTSSDAMSLDPTSSSAGMDIGSSSNQTINHSNTSLNPSSLHFSLTAENKPSTLSVVSSSSATSNVTTGTCTASVSTDTHISVISYDSGTFTNSKTSQEPSIETLESSTAENSSLGRQPPNHHSNDSDITADRWTHACSDEEKELERIEIYRENRRKRYQNALEEKRKHSNVTPRTEYYSTNSS